MAYGMLTSALLGAGTGLVKFGMDKVARSMEEEAKVKAEAEREARIEEAAKRSEERAMSREQSIYERNQADKTLETGANRQWIVDTEKRAAAEKLIEEQRKQDWEKDPTNPSYQSTMQQINASKESVKSSESALKNAELTREKTQLEIDKEKGLADLTQRINSETDVDKRDTLIQQAKVIGGKFNDRVDQIKTTEIDTGRVDDNGKPIMKKILVRVEDNGQWNVLPVEERLKMAQPYDKEQADIVARDMTNRQIGARTDNLVLDRDKNNADKWDKTFTENQSKLLTTKQGDTVSFDDKKGGMLLLNKGIISEKPAENPLDASKVETGKVSKTESLIKTDNPVEQKQLDSLFNVIKAGESGGKGVDAGTPKPTPDNPNPSASGTFQIIDANLKSHGIKPELPNGKYSPAQKDAFAPTFYKEVYEKTGGNQAAMVAAGFGQEDVYQAIAKAKAKGSNSWWDYLNPSGGVENNMPIIKNRIKQQQQYLIKNDIPVPVSISDFRLNNK